jgi:hypothetical protein
VAWIRLRWEKDSRYYEVWLRQDLWDEWLLTQAWGRQGTRLGRIRELPLTCYQDGIERLERIKKRRKQRGYTLNSTSILTH